MRGRKGPHEKDGKIYTTEHYDDLIAAGMLALWWSALRCDSSSGLNAYARWRIHGAVGDEAWAFEKRGIAGETRLIRFVRSKRYLSHAPELIVAKAKKLRRPIYCSVGQVEHALEVVRQVGRRVSLSTIETTKGDAGRSDGSCASRSASSGLLDGRWRAGGEAIVGDYLADRKARGMYSVFDKSQLSPHLLHHEGLRTESKFYRWPEYPRCGMSGVVDKLAEDADGRDEQRFKQIGRRAYATELAPKLRRRTHLLHGGVGLGFDASGYS